MFVDTDGGLIKGNNMSYVTTAQLASKSERSLGRSSFKENASPGESVKEDKDRNGVRGLFRSASEINLPQTGEQLTNGNKEVGIKRVFSEHTLQSPTSDGTERDKQGTSTIEGVKKSLRRHSIKLRKEPKITISQQVLPSNPTNGEIAQLPKALVKNSKKVSDARPEMQSSLSLPKMPTRKRSTWIIGASRSPSPNNRTVLENATRIPEKVAIKRSSNEELDPSPELRKSPTSPTQQVPQQVPLQRKNTSGSSRSRRPLSAVFGRSKSFVGAENVGVPAIPKSFSTDRLPLRSYESRSQLPELPKAISKEQFRNAGYETPRKKDELWSTFRTLDGDFQKFSSKPGTLKSSVIRSSLLPFLRQYADHPSNISLRAEDLDRRANILNKWWTGLLEMLNGRNGQSVSGNDRPAVLEGLSTIMARPEWQLTISAVSSRPEKKAPSLKSRSSTSLASNMSDFLAESVIHNVRNTFTQNLLSQMAFVVDRMSQRSVPASVVTFCGKACAYAFFFCPGVAEILVRLWSQSSDMLRRVLDEYGMSRTCNLSETAETVSQLFPHHLRSLSFTSLPKLMRSLRAKPLLSLNNAYIPWNGPWVGRWSGRDSDLFFCFVKHYHVLAYDMLPENSTVEQRVAAPCAILVQSQILAVMDATVHRAAQGSTSEPLEGALPITFDDLLGADASALPLSARAPNASRSMAENRLVMLLREFLSDSPTVKDKARHSFADLFSSILKATAKRVSVYDHNACFTLCDLLEECNLILSRYYRHPEDAGLFLDFDFWFKVLKEMGESNNSMTEVRLFAFVYRFWGLISKNEERKRDMCLNWLLREDYALRQFSHWCPMVRAYYMRVLCWKILRFDGESTEVDLEIYKTASLRFRTVWSHYLYHQREANGNGKLPISTAPSNPAPGRRMLIIRDDSAPAPTGTFQSFDSVVSSTSSQPNAYERYSSLDPLKNLAPPDTKSRSPSPGKRRFSVLRNMNPFSSSSNDLPKKPVIEEKPPVSIIQANGRPPALDTAAVKAAASGPTALTTASIPHSFKFSLEWADRAMPPRERKLSPPRLPGPAQMHLQSKTQDPGLPQPRKPDTEEAVAASKYCGRALAEWAVLIGECQNFYDRRQGEGVKNIRFVETPTLGVESFRRPVG